MATVIVRNDDVSPRSNFKEIREMYALLKKYIPDVEIYSCINLISHDPDTSNNLNKKNIQYHTIDKMFDFKELPYLENIVSHGLFHFDHRAGSGDLVKASILGSCQILNTKLFIPPFWRWSDKMQRICDQNGIKLWTKEDWINFETTGFKENHDRYLFHSWRWTPEKLKENYKLFIKKTKLKTKMERSATQRSL
jgi:hypothetical protein